METKLLNNRYRMLQTLGRGGFGETFLATDIHLPSERQCVIKQLKPAVQPPEEWVKDRFHREAAILEELGEKSPQIPRLYAYFAEGGDFYLVQEWIEGVNLKQKVNKEGPLKEEEVTEILRKLLPVLEYTHSYKIIHRDIKPENIILRQSDRLPVLIDFGAVKEAVITQANQQGSMSIAIGTSGYMASEQAAGRPVYSSDLYSLGLTAIYLLTGMTPQELESDSQTGEILWREKAPHLHSNLASVIDRAIRFHPRDRFPSAQVMLQALTPQQQASTGRTLVVAPEYPQKKAENPTGATLALNHPYLEPQGNNPLKLLIPLFLGGITLGTLFLLFGVSLFLPRDKSIPVVTPETSTPAPLTLPTLEPHRSGAVAPYATQVPVTPEEITKEPETIVPLDPKPTPVTTEVPTFNLGTEQEQILQAMGEPDSQQRGFWHNTIVWSYSNAVTGVEVKYLFDTETQQLRQSEAIFSPDTSLELMQETLNSFLGGKAPSAIQTALEAVYSNQTDLRSFNHEQKKGMIRRDTREKINIIVSAADFH
nr:serine/threonine-protein kinase [Gloeocapsa sp. PCC 73106]